MKSIGKKKKEEREGEEKNGRTIEKKARRTSGGEVSRFFSPAFEIVLEVYTSRLTEKSSFRYLLKAIRHKTESTGPTSPVASLSLRPIGSLMGVRYHSAAATVQKITFASVKLCGCASLIILAILSALPPHSSRPCVVVARG